MAFHTTNSHQFLFSFDWCPVLVGQTTLQFSSLFCRLEEQLRGKGAEQFTEWFGSVMGAAESDKDPPEQQQSRLSLLPALRSVQAGQEERLTLGFYHERRNQQQTEAAQVLESSGFVCSGPGTSLSLWGRGRCQELLDPCTGQSSSSQ